MNVSIFKTNLSAAVRLCLCIVAVFAPPIAGVSTAHAASVFDPSDLFGEVIQTGRGNNADDVRGALNFRVRAFVDDGTGNTRDGEGIRNVDMIIVDRNDREVQRRREGSAGYCAFGGGEPNCNTYVFADHNNRWPNGDPIRSGEEYTLRAIINAKDGRQTVIERSLVIRLADKGKVIGEVIQTGRGDNADTVQDALNFRVRAFVDNGTGNNRDGDGIRNVDLSVIDSDGREVQRKREGAAGYCAFGGGEPNCNTYVFADHNDRWPNGDPVRHGEDYTLRAVVTARDGRKTVIERTVMVE